jgi:hypothetical protein
MVNYSIALGGDRVENVVLIAVISVVGHRSHGGYSAFSRLVNGWLDLLRKLPNNQF